MIEQDRSGRGADEPGTPEQTTTRGSVHPQIARERQEKSDRLVAALRENLKRRKQQARARASGETED